MSYHVLQKPADIYEAAAGMGAFVRTFPSDPYRRGGVARVVRTNRWGVPFAYQGFGAIEFNGAGVWADWVQGAPPVNNNTAGKRAANAIRAALAQLGYGQLTMDVPWGDADIAAYKAWCGANGLTKTALPTKDALLVMDTQVKQNQVTGTQPPVVQTKVGDTYVPASTLAPSGGGGAAKPGLSMVGMGLVAVGLIGIAAIAIAARRKGRVQPVSGPLTASAAPARA